jgi:hypothetical protein
MKTERKKKPSGKLTKSGDSPKTFKEDPQRNNGLSLHWALRLG